VPEEVKEAKFAWLQLCTKYECTRGLSDEDEYEVEEEGSTLEEVDVGKVKGVKEVKEATGLQGKDSDIAMAQTLKSDEVINCDESDMSDFQPPFKKKAKTIKFVKGEKTVLPKSEGNAECLKESESVASSLLLYNGDTNKKLLARAKKNLEGRTISYPRRSPSAEIDSTMFYLMQQQQKQREDDRATREQQLATAKMECEANDRSCEERKEQRERRHQDFMMMMMMMITGNKKPVQSFTNLSSSSSATTSSSTSSPHAITPPTYKPAPAFTPTPSMSPSSPPKEYISFDEMEKRIGEETVLHDTVLYMKTPPHPSDDDSNKDEVEKIHKIKKHLKDAGIDS
jgi:hypothetical protein